MRVGHRVLALTTLAGTFALVGGLALGSGGSAQAQTGASPTPAVNAGGPQAVPLARFFGTVTAATGSTIAPGAMVVATIGTVTCGTGAANNGNYFVDIQAISGCVGSTANIAFTVGGLRATQTGTLPAVQGTAVQLNLTVAAATPSPTASPAASPPPPPPPPPSTPRPTAPPTAVPTTAPTAAPTAAPAVVPTVAPTIAPTAVVPVRPPQTGLGGAAEQQKPSGPAVVTGQKPAVPAVVTAQKPAVPAAIAPAVAAPVSPAAGAAAVRPAAAAAPALPNTGTGTLAGSPDGVMPGMLALAALVALMGACGVAMAYRRS